MVVLVFNRSDRRGSSSGFGSRPASVAQPAVANSDENPPQAASNGFNSQSSTGRGRHYMPGSEGYMPSRSIGSSDGFPTASNGFQGAGSPSAAQPGPGARSLLADAELGAERQVQCRDTMISLRDAFEGALNSQSQMEAARQADRERLARLRAQHLADQRRLQELLEKVRQLENQDGWRRIAELQAEVEEIRKRMEEAKVEKWKERLFNHKGTFNFVMMLSRNAHPLGAMSSDSRVSAEGGPQSDLAHTYDGTGGRPPSGEAGDRPQRIGSKASKADPARRSRVGFVGYSAADESGAPIDTGAGPDQRQSASQAQASASGSAYHIRAGSDGAQGEGSRAMSESFYAVANPKGPLTVGDNLSFKWIMKLWKHHIKSRHFVRSNDIGIQAIRLPDQNDCQTQTEEAKAEDHGQDDSLEETLERLRKQHQLELEAEREKSEREKQSLQDEIMDLKYDKKQADKLRADAEQERDALAEQLAEANESHATERERLLAEVASVRKEAQLQMTEKEQQMRQLRQQLESQQDLFQRQKAALENERNALKRSLREMSSELQNALSLARRMQLLAEKLKKEGMGALKDKIAQLIADLDAARNKLCVAIKDRDEAVEKTDGLERGLAKTQRKLELERQFLPLIHMTRGPVGQQNALLSKKSHSRSEPKLPSISQPEMLQ